MRDGTAPDEAPIIVVPLTLVMTAALGMVVVPAVLLWRGPADPPQQPQSWPAGWYPDPLDPARRRYFDGRGWTNYVE